MLKQVERYIKNWEEQQRVNLPLEEYLKKGYELKEGLTVYIKSLQDFECDILAQDKSVDYPFMIWKIKNNRVYAFPVRVRDSRGHFLPAIKYFKKCDLTVKPNLVSFSINNISRIDMQLDSYDYKRTLQDIYERMCIFGTIANSPKNYFVTEIEKNITVQVGDVITMYDIPTKYRRYYYIVDIDEEHQVYKGMKITHNNGDIALKDNNIFEIPFSSYIMEKVTISPENKERIMEAISKLEDSSIKR